jgi:hypothetical protein
MKLTDLKNQVDKFIGRKRKGKKLKSTQIQIVLDKLEKKERRVNKEYANESSAKEIKRLELQKKVLKAQMKKARKLLNDLD